jgi:hypothetical protein
MLDLNHNFIKMTTFINETFEKNENGEMVLVHTEIVEVKVPTPEEIIAEKQAELLKMYAELNALKTQQ